MKVSYLKQIKPCSEFIIPVDLSLTDFSVNQFLTLVIQRLTRIPPEIETALTSLIDHIEKNKNILFNPHTPMDVDLIKSTAEAFRIDIVALIETSGCIDLEIQTDVFIQEINATTKNGEHGKLLNSTKYHYKLDLFQDLRLIREIYLFLSPLVEVSSLNLPPVNKLLTNLSVILIHPIIRAIMNQKFALNYTVFTLMDSHVKFINVDKFILRVNKHITSKIEPFKVGNSIEPKGYIEVVLHMGD